MWQPVYVGVGSNLDQPVEQVREALRRLSALPQAWFAACSRLYRTRPLGPPGQPDYVNAVVAVLSSYEPETLLDELQAIERDHGRDRSGERWSARTLDLDVLAVADQVIDTPRLTVPHPELHRRDFVLGPWLDVAPSFFVPGRGRIEVLAREVDLSTLKPVPTTECSNDRAGSA